VLTAAPRSADFFDEIAITLAAPSILVSGAPEMITDDVSRRTMKW